MMNNTTVVKSVSEKTGLSPDICEQVIRALELTLQEELGRNHGLGALSNIAAYVRHLLPNNVQ